MHPKPSRSRFRRLLAGALATSGVQLAACTEPPVELLDLGDGGVASAGLVTVHTASTSVPALVATVTLGVGSMEAGSDREPDSAATIQLGAPLGFESDDPTVVSAALPATYGRVRLLGIDSLTLTTTTNARVVVEFGAVAPIELRCAGPGTYLPVAGSIDVTVSVDLASIQNELTASGNYPPLVPLVTVTNPVLVGTIFTRLQQSLSVVCGP